MEAKKRAAFAEIIPPKGDEHFYSSCLPHCPLPLLPPPRGDGSITFLLVQKSEAKRERQRGKATQRVIKRALLLPSLSSFASLSTTLRSPLKTLTAAAPPHELLPNRSQRKTASTDKHIFGSRAKRTTYAACRQYGFHKLLTPHLRISRPKEFMFTAHNNQRAGH